MLTKINLFLNKFELFFKRVGLSILLFGIVPIILLGYIFGFFSFDVKNTHDIDKEN